MSVAILRRSSELKLIKNSVSKVRACNFFSRDLYAHLCAAFFLYHILIISLVQAHLVAELQFPCL